MQRGFFEPIDVKQTVRRLHVAEAVLRRARKDALLAEIRTKGALDKDLEARLQAACDEWKASYTG